MKKAYLFAGISIFFWSTLAVTAKLLLGELNSIQLLCASSLIVGVALLAVNIATGKMKLLKSYKPKDYLKISLIGLLGTFLYYIFYYSGAAVLSASQAFIINYMWPIMSVVFACIILKEKLTAKKVIAILLSFLGVAIVIGGDLLAFNKDILTGILLCALGAVSYGLFTALNQKAHYDNCISMMIWSFVAFVLTAVMLAFSGDLFLPSGMPQILGLLWNGIFTMAIPNTLWIIALEKGNTAKISNLAYITPFLSLVWSAVILKEEIGLNSIIGLIVIVLGILIQLNDRSQKA